MIREVIPVAQAVMVEQIGPVAPVNTETRPPTMLIQELGLVKGWGIFCWETIRRSASKNRIQSARRRY